MKNKADQAGRRGDGPAKINYRLLAEFRRLLRRFLSFSEAEAARHGLTPQQHQALLAIKGYPNRQSVTVGDLADWLDIRPHSAVGLIDRLAARKLVTRRTDPSDRRQIRVELTPSAERLLRALSLVHREELRQLAPILSALVARLRAASAGRA